MKILTTPALLAFAVFLAAHSAHTSDGAQNNPQLPPKTDLSNGAVLNVDLSNVGFANTLISESLYTVGSPVPIMGKASVGKGIPDVSYIFMIDSSSSTNAEDGDCGTVLKCVQDFFVALHNETLVNGSAKQTAVIDFDGITTVTAPFTAPNPTNATASTTTSTSTIHNAIYSGISFGGTVCVEALNKATELVNDPSNKAGTTVVVFAGDGLCNDEPAEVRDAADALGATGAIVHTVAVGDNVNCTESHSNNFWYNTTESNNMLDIPQNGGNCTSVPDPNTLPNIIDDLIGTALVSLELNVDGENYTFVSQDDLSLALPQEGAVSVHFNTSTTLSITGNHNICVRATGEDSLGGRSQVEDCHNVIIVPEEEEDNAASPDTTSPMTKKDSSDEEEEGSPGKSPLPGLVDIKDIREDKETDTMPKGSAIAVIAIAACAALVGVGLMLKNLCRAEKEMDDGIQKTTATTECPSGDCAPVENKETKSNLPDIA